MKCVAPETIFTCPMKSHWKFQEGEGEGVGMGMGMGMGGGGLQNQGFYSKVWS